LGNNHYLLIAIRDFQKIKYPKHRLQSYHL
jgi:hypothetical protein